MSYERAGGVSLDYNLCEYDGSRLSFRGPKKSLEEPFVACIGGTDTFGKFVAHPFPDLLEDALGIDCVNLGVPQASVDAFWMDIGVLSIAARAEVSIVQIMSVHNLSNRFYTVHPRRNDRFLSASETMTRLFPEIDFTEFHFTNHMLRSLAKTGGERFLLVLKELQQAWIARMRQFIDRIGSPVVLLWFSDHAPEEKRGLNHTASTPFGVTARMLTEVSSGAAGVVVAQASEAALARGNEGMIFEERDLQASIELLGPSAHVEAADKLAQVLPGLMAS